MTIVPESKLFALPARRCRSPAHGGFLRGWKRESVETSCPWTMASSTDYDDEGRKLMASLTAAAASSSNLYNPMDAIWKDEATGGTVFVGNVTAAQEAKKRGITHVVNCTDDMANFCEGAGVKYLRFNVAYWQAAGDSRKYHPATQSEIMQFVQTVFDFVDAALRGGGQVLVHCLAGAHRAGTTGCLLIMYKTGMGQQEAIRTAKKLRGIINPIGGLPEFLRTYEAGRAKGSAKTCAAS